MPVLLELSPAPAAGRLADSSRCFIEEHRIRGSEADPKQRATIVTVANLLQDVGGNHGVTLWGRGDSGFAATKTMVKNNLIFAMTRLQIQMDSYPKWGDVVSVETWFQADKKITAPREWLVRDSTTGKTCGRATSTWVMLSTETRKLVRIPEDFREVLETFSPEPRRHSMPEAESKLKLPEVAEPFEIIGPVQVARRSDMDMNGHINNVTYLAWALETVPADVYNKGHLYQVEIDFKAECMAGDTVESVGQCVPDAEVTCVPAPTCEAAAGKRVVQYVHLLRRCDEDGCTELVRTRTTWLLD